MEDLEEKYAENIEKEEELFLEGLQNKKSLAELEKEYSRKVKEIRRIYEKSLKKDLNEEKEREIKKAKKKVKSTEKEGKEFHVINLELEENWKERKQIEIASWGYKTKRKIYNFIRIIIPNYTLYIYYKIVRILSDLFKDVKNIFENILEKISEGISNSFSFVKEGFIKIVSSVKKIWDILKEKGKKYTKNDKKEDANKKSKKQNK